MPNGEGLTEEERSNLRDWFNNYITAGNYRERFPQVDWGAVVEAYVAGEEIPRPEVAVTREQAIEQAVKGAQARTPYMGELELDANEAIDKLISDVETGADITPEKIRAAGKPDWFADLSDEDKDFYDNFVEQMRSDFEVLGMDMGEEQMAEAADYFGALIEAKVNYGQTTGVDVSAMTLEQFLATSAGQIAVETAGITIPPGLEIVEDRDRFNEALQEKLGAVPEEFRSFTVGNFADLPQSLQTTFTDLLREAVSDKATVIASETGRPVGEITIDEVLSGLTETDIEGVRQGALSSWLASPEGRKAIPLQGSLQQLSRVAGYTGMTESEYLQNAYKNWKSTMHPDYIAQTGETQLWSQFLGQPVVDAIGGDIATATGAVGREKETIREQLTPKYVPAAEVFTGKVPSQQDLGSLLGAGRQAVARGEAAPGFGVLSAMKGEIPTYPGGGGAEGGRPPVELTQANARAAYIKELKRRGYKGGDLAYLSQFFSTLLPGPYPQKVLTGPGGFWDGLSEIEIPSPPRRREKKTRFLGGIR